MGILSDAPKFNQADLQRQQEIQSRLRKYGVMPNGPTPAEAFAGNNVGQDGTGQTGQDPNYNDTIGNGPIGHFIDSAQAGAASMAGGVLRFGSEYLPFGKDALNSGADYFDDIVQRNTPIQELSGLDYVANAAGNALGSGAASMAMGYALLGIAGAAGLGGSAVAAVGAAAAQNPKLAGVANFLSKIPMTKGVASAVSRINGSKLSLMLASQIAGSPMEAMSEGGNLIQQMRQDGYSDDEIAAAGLKSFGMNTVWLTLMNSLEGATIEKLATKLASKEGVKVGAKEIAKRAGIGAATKAAGEGPEEFGQNVIGNMAEGVPINWEEAKEAGIQGAVGAAVLGGVGGPIAPYLAKRNKTKQEAPSDVNAPTGDAAKQAVETDGTVTPKDARTFLEAYRDTESKGEEYAAIDEILESGDDATILQKAAELGYGAKVKEETPKAEEPPKADAPKTEPPKAEEPPKADTPPKEEAKPKEEVKTPEIKPDETEPPAAPEAAPWNGEKVKIGSAEMSPVVSKDGMIVMKGGKGLTTGNKKAMKKNGFVWDSKKQAYAAKDTPESRKWLGNYAIAGTQAVEPVKDEHIQPKDKLGDFNFVEQDKENGIIRLTSATNPNKLAVLGKDNKGVFKAAVFNKGETFKDKTQKFKTLEEAEAYIANYKEEPVKPVETIKDETIKDDTIKGKTPADDGTPNNDGSPKSDGAPHDDGTPAGDGAEEDTAEPVKTVKPKSNKKKWKGGNILVGGVEMAPVYDKETHTINIELPAGRELSDDVRTALEAAGMQETGKGSWEGLSTKKLQDFLETGELALKEKEKETASFMEKKFKKKVGKYAVNEYDDNTDLVHNYLHSDDDGEKDSRWMTLEKKNGKFAVSMGYVGGATEKTAEVATLEEAEQYVKDNDLPPKAKEEENNGDKEKKGEDNSDKDKGKLSESDEVEEAEADDDKGKGKDGETEELEDKVTPPKEEEDTPPKEDAVDSTPDGNGITPLVKGMGVEAKNTRIAENDKALIALAEKAKKEYEDGTLTAKGARELISTYVSLYNKGGSLMPVSKVALSKLAEIRKSITALEKEKANAPKLEAKRIKEEALAAGEKLVQESCDKIIADEGKAKDETVWLEASKLVDNKLAEGGQKALSKTAKEDLERKYRNMLKAAKEEAIKLGNQYYDIRKVFENEARNIYNSVRDWNLDAEKGLEEYNKLKEKFEADIKAINRKADSYVRQHIYDRTEKFLNAMMDERSPLPHYIKFEQTLEKAEDWFRNALRFVDPKDFSRPWLKTDGQRKIKEYEKMYQDAYDEYKKAVEGLDTEYNEKADKLYQKAKDSWNAIIERKYPVDYIHYLAYVAEYDEKANAILAEYGNKNMDAKEAIAQLEKLNADFTDTFNKVTGKEDYFKNFFFERLKVYYSKNNFDYAAQKNIDALKAAIEERGDSVTPANPTSLEGNNFGEYTDSVFGAGTMADILNQAAALKKEQETNLEKKEVPTEKDKAVVDGMVEEKVTEAAELKDPIEDDDVINQIDNIIKNKKDSATTKYFNNHSDVKLEIKNALEKGLTALYYVEYKAKDGKGSQTKYYYTLVGDDTLHKMQGVAIRVMAKLAGDENSPMKIVPLNLKEYKEQQKSKYLKELPSDDESFDEFDDWLYKWYGDDLDIYSIIGILKAEYTNDNPCPLNSLLRQSHETIINELWDGDWTFKSLGDAVRKALLINKAYGDYNKDYTIVLDGEVFESLPAEQLDAVEKYISWWEQELDSNTQKYPIETRSTAVKTEEDIISDEALKKKVQTEEEKYKEDFAEKSDDELDVEAEANMAEAEEYAKKVATADALDKAKAKQKEKIARAEKEGKRVSEVSETESTEEVDSEALAAFNLAAEEIDSLYKADSNEQAPLENFASSIIKQVIHAGYITLKKNGKKLYQDWRSSMENLIDSSGVSREQGKSYAKRMLDAVWDFITSLPERVSFAADKIKQTLSDIATALDVALTMNSNGFGYEQTKAALQKSNQPLYNNLKDYLPSAFKALVRYPRRGIDNHGGGNNVDVRASKQPATGDSGRRNGVGVETNSGNNGRGSQMGSGTPTGGETEQKIQAGGASRGNTQKTGSNVSGGRPAAVGTQSNIKGGKKEPNDKTGLPRGANEGRSSSSGDARNAELLGKRAKNNSNISERDAGTQGNDAASATISSVREQLKKLPFKAADEKGIAEAVPVLLPEQIADEVAIEKRLWTNNGKGMLVANGTGTGKTIVGLAQVVRFIQRGAKKILIVVPNSTVKDRWVEDAKLLGLPKELFETLTSGDVADDKVNVVSYKSFSDNKNILEQSWDLVVLDEAHNISSGQDAAEYDNTRTNNAQTLRAITGHERTGFDDYIESKYRAKFNLLNGTESTKGLRAIFQAADKEYNDIKGSPYQTQEILDNAKAKRDAAYKAMRDAEIEIERLKDKERSGYEKRLLARNDDTRVLMLSATPFAYGNSVYYAEGLLFNYDGHYNDFMMKKFDYVERNDKTVGVRLENGRDPSPNHDKEAAFHNELVDSGAMINRILEVPQDYNRKFVKVKGGIGSDIDEGFDYINTNYKDAGLNEFLVKRFDYHSLRRLLEAIKAEAAIPIIKEYIRQGKKVVLFHDFVEEDKVTPHPFKLSAEEKRELNDNPALRDAYSKFCNDPEIQRLQALPFGGVRAADAILEEAFGNSMTTIKSKVSFKKREARVKAFNNADSGVNLISITTQAGKEGISLHDKEFDGDGNRLRSVPRVLINIGMPTRPTDAIQTEGRIYRLGQQSNAMFRYLFTDTNTELKAYNNYVSQRTTTAETLALGDKARNLSATFSYGYLEARNSDAIFNAAADTVDTGGKALDNMSDEEVHRTLRKMRMAATGKSAADDNTLYQIDKQIQALEDKINAKKRAEILTPENEAKTVNAIKNAVNGGKVTKVNDGVYVVALPNGMNLWFDLNESQAAILSRMGEAEKQRMLSAHDLRNSGYVIRGAYTQKYAPQSDGIMSLIKLTEAATQHTADHEVYHFVQKMLLTPSELSRVMDYWKYKLKKDIGVDAYSQLSEKQILDRCLEMDADMHASFMAQERKPKNFIERVAWKVTKWLINFANKFGIDTPAGMYLRTASGEMFARKGNQATEAPARYQAAGVKAKTANLDKLSNAEKMEKQGKIREEIFDATGWWRAEDGKWRFEIKDNVENIALDKLGKLEVGEGMPLNELYNSPELFKAYPKLKDIVVKKEALGLDTAGGYSAMDNVIELAYQRVDDAVNSPTESVVVNTPNGKYYITERGFGSLAVRPDGSMSSGAGFAIARIDQMVEKHGAIDRVLSRVERLRREALDKIGKRDSEEEKEYYRDQVLMYDNYKPYLSEYKEEVEKIPFPYGPRKDLFSTIIHEIQHAVQTLEGHARGGNYFDAMNNVLEEERALKHKIMADPSYDKDVIEYYKYDWGFTGTEETMYKARMDHLDELKSKFSDEQFGQYYRIYDQFQRLYHNKYLDIAGEREARQASARMSDNTRAHYPWDNLDQLNGSAPLVLFEEALPSGDIRFSITPVDEVNGKGMPDDLKNVINTPESTQEPKQYKNVDEVMPDAQKFADETKTTGEIKVKDTSMKKGEKNKVVGVLDATIGSPSELAKKNPVFRSFYRIYQKAEEVQEKLRSRWRKQFQSDIAELKTNDEMDMYLDLNLEGEIDQKEFTIDELQKRGISDNVIKAYTRTRQLIRNIWEAVNDAHRGLVNYTDRMDAKAIKELAKKPFEENIMVREALPEGNPAAFVPLKDAKLEEGKQYDVKHSKPLTYRSEEILTKEQLDELRASPYADVADVNEHKIKGFDMVMYKAKVTRVAAPVGKIAGYLPHIFEQWLVMVNTEDGAQIVGSGKNLDLALKEAEKLKAQTKGNVDFYIAPKIFDPSGFLDGNVADGKQGNPNITLSSQEFAKLEKALRDTFKISIAEANMALGKVAKREGRSRFLGNIRFRKGRVGYNSDMIESLDRYISMTSRYCALQPAKRRAVSLYERTFGPVDKDYNGKDSMAVVVRRYMRYCNGTPNFLESWLTSQLNKLDWWKRNISSTYGDRTLMALAGKANGLLSMSLLGCFNISSAVVGLTQLVNTYGLIGGRYLGEGMAAVQRMSLRDKRILAEAGIPYNIGLDTPSGFTKRRDRIDGSVSFANMQKMLSYAGNKGMYFFKQADKLTRNATTLGAYYKAIADGMTHKQAIIYAKDINRRANFSYGAADAAGLFQWTAGTGLGELSTLFQKYPMKEWELMKSLMPVIGSGSKAEKARFWGAYFLMAGLAGVPAGEWLDWLIETLFGVNPSAAFKSVLFKEYGDTALTRTIAYGIGSNVGVDISRRVGMANMIPDSASMWGYLFGPAGNITERMIRTAASGDFTKTIKAISPAIGNLAEAVIHGYSTNSKGQINYIYNDAEKVLKSMGFRPVGESMDSDLRATVYMDRQKKKDGRQKVLMEMVKKRTDGEALTNDDYKALREQGITPAQFQKAVKEAKMTAIQRTRARMTKQQKKDFAGTPIMEEDE